MSRNNISKLVEMKKEMNKDLREAIEKIIMKNRITFPVTYFIKRCGFDEGMLEFINSLGKCNFLLGVR